MGFHPFPCRLRFIPVGINQCPPPPSPPQKKKNNNNPTTTTTKNHQQQQTKQSRNVVDFHSFPDLNLHLVLSTVKKRKKQGWYGFFPSRPSLTCTGTRYHALSRKRRNKVSIAFIPLPLNLLSDQFPCAGRKSENQSWNCGHISPHRLSFQVPFSVKNSKSTRFA